MNDKLEIIRLILQSDDETDRKILSLLRTEQEPVEPEGKTVYLDERDSSRKPVDLPANIDTGRGNIEARVKDVSVSGAFIRTDKKIAMGEEIAIRLMSPDGEEFSFISEVKRVEQDGIGVMIKTAQSFNQDRFARFVRQL